MNLSIFTKFILLLLVIAAFASFAFAQATPDKPEQTNQTPQVFGENDRLPFMQSEQMRESNEPSSSGLLFKTLGAMLLIVGLIFFGAWGLKKLGFGGTKANLATNAPDLSVLSTVSLGTNRTISVVKFGERMLLIGSTPQNFTLLADTKGEKPVSMMQSRSVAELLAEDDNSFAEEFAQAQSRLNLMDERGELI